MQRIATTRAAATSISKKTINGVFLEQETDTWLPRLATFGVLWQF